MNRPERVKCVRRTRVDHKEESWCGKRIEDWAFVDVAHAAENGASGGRLIVCPMCLDAITKALRSGYP